MKNKILILLLGILLLGITACKEYEYKYKLIYHNGDAEILVVSEPYSYQHQISDDCFVSWKKKTNSNKKYKVKRCGVRQRILLTRKTIK